MKITKVVPPTKGGTLWSGGAISDRQHYLWMAERDGGRCDAYSGKLKDPGHVSRNGVEYSRFYKSLRRPPSALVSAVTQALA
jgi:hypothetical protein